MTNYETCPTCGSIFNPAFLDQVAEHMHDGIEIKQLIKGDEVMIGTKDLMRGNLVQIMEEGNICRCTVETIGDVVALTTNGVIIHQVKAHDISGIELSPEVLVNNCRFIKGDESGRYACYCKLYQKYNKYEIEFDKASNEFTSAHIGNDEHMAAVIMPKYLHELQNSYRWATGTDLEIINL